MGKDMNNGGDVLFVLMGAVMVLAMHAGFAFLEVGTVRKKNQVNALVKIIADFAVSTLAYFFVGYGIAYGTSFFTGAHALADKNGYELVKFFFLLTFAAAIPAIISGGIAERARFYPQLAATALLVGLVYPFFEGITWNGNFGLQAWLEAHFGAKFHDFAGSVVVHAVGGWLALVAVVLLGARHGRYAKDGKLVAINSLMAMGGGVLAALFVGRNDPGFVHNGPLAGLGAICAGSDLMHPVGALITGAVAGGMFVFAFMLTQNKWRIDDVLGVWPLHGRCGVWGCVAAGIFGSEALGGMGGVSLMSQIVGTGLGVVVALIGGGAVYGLLKVTAGLRLSQEEEYRGADLSIHKIGSEPPYD